MHTQKKLCEVRKRGGQFYRTYCANSLSYINVQARRTRFDLAKIASDVLEIIGRVKTLQDIMVLCTDSGCFENIKVQNFIIG